MTTVYVKEGGGGSLNGTSDANAYATTDAANPPSFE